MRVRGILIALLLAGAVARCGEGLVDSNGNTIIAPQTSDAGCDAGEALPDGGCDDHRGDR